MKPLNVPLLDLSEQYAAISDEIDEAMQRVIRSQRFILGPEVESLEQELADYCQAKYCIGVSSGSDALLMALMALDVTHGDEVITSSYTFFATGGAIARLGATPVFVDIDPLTFNIDPALVEDAITPHTKAIIPVHLYGQCANMTAINEIATRYGLPVIEDAAQAIGAEYEGRRAGSLGTMGCFSFFPSKNLGCFGDGGAITTNDADLNHKLRCLRMHGSEPKYYHKLVGGNFRLDSIQAAIVSVKLKYLDSWTAGRQENAQIYDAAFQNLDQAAGKIVTPQAVQNRHVFNQYIIRAEGRDDLMAWLKQHNVGCEIYYPVPLHLQECFASLGYKLGDLPKCEQAADGTLALPIFPELSKDQLRYVAKTVDSYYGAASGNIPDTTDNRAAA